MKFGPILGGIASLASTLLHIHDNPLAAFWSGMVFLWCLSILFIYIPKMKEPNARRRRDPKGCETSRTKREEREGVRVYEMNDYQDPKWDEAKIVHEWKNYIDEEVRAMWTTFSAEQREALGKQAENQASLEEWD